MEKRAVSSDSIKVIAIHTDVKYPKRNWRVKAFSKCEFNQQISCLQIVKSEIQYYQLMIYKVPEMMGLEKE